MPVNDVEILFEPIEQWPRERTQSRRRSPFRAEYKDTIDRLVYELAKLGADQAVIQLDLAHEDIRMDGLPRAQARPDDPGVIVAADTRYGPLQWPCDAFTDWRANLRAIALTLERLRMADLYGVTAHGEQYTGWQKLPPPEEDVSSADAAARFIARFGGSVGATLLSHGPSFRRAYREAAMRLHPDRGGSDEQFQRLERARETLERHHGLRE